MLLLFRSSTLRAECYQPADASLLQSERAEVWGLGVPTGLAWAWHLLADRVPVLPHWALYVSGSVKYIALCARNISQLYIHIKVTCVALQILVASFHRHTC
jgi:hypothetical protein